LLGCNVGDRVPGVFGPVNDDAADVKDDSEPA
jgi:hypothetical protein